MRMGSAHWAPFWSHTFAHPRNQINEESHLINPKNIIKLFLQKMFSKYVLIIILILDSLQLQNLSIVPSLPNIFDPAVLMRSKPSKIVDLMGDSNDVLIRENITNILEHRIFFR